MSPPPATRKVALRRHRLAPSMVVPSAGAPPVEPADASSGPGPSSTGPSSTGPSSAGGPPPVRLPPRRRRAIPTWFILLAIALTALVTVWTVRSRSPQKLPIDNQPAWTEAMLPAVGAAGQLQPIPRLEAQLQAQPQAQPVAAVRGVPTITAGTPRPHDDRGSCTRCHAVVRPGGAPMPVITADSWMPHTYPGGMCINCHQSVPPVFGATTRVAAQTAPAAAAGAAAEASWMGLEVAPITPVTAQQFATPAGLQGVVVTEVEGRAQAAGLQAGDVVVAINGRQITDLPSFTTVTANGLLPRGNVQVLRSGRLVETVLETATPPVSTVPQTMVPAATQPVPVTQAPMAPMAPLPPAAPDPAAPPIAPTAVVVPIPAPVEAPQPQPQPAAPAPPAACTAAAPSGL